MASENSCLSSGRSVFCTWLMPETLIHARLGSYYQENPMAARVVATPIAFLSGVVKLFLFPVICTVGIIVMPIIALIRACQDKPHNGSWLSAWCFCILGVAASVAFVGVTTFHVPLVISVGIFVALLSISITLHVYKLVKEPPDTISSCC